MKRKISALSAAAASATLGLALLVVPSSAQAATYTVTNSNCDGAGSLKQAIIDANGNAGPDTISIDASVTYDVSACWGSSYPADSTTYYMFEVTDSVTIVGNGARASGVINWISNTGQVNPLTGQCPATTPGWMLANTSPGFLRITGSGVDVTVQDLTVTQVNSLARVNSGGNSLTLNGVTANQIWDARYCETPAIVARADADVTLANNSWTSVVNFASPFGFHATVPAIEGTGAGNLAISGSVFKDVFPGSTVAWDGAAASTMKIVSSQFQRYGGILADGAVTTEIVNSAWTSDYGFGDPEAGQSILNSSSGPMTIRASTLMFPSSYCDSSCQTANPAAQLGTNGSGPLNLVQTSVGVNDVTGTGNLIAGSVTADDSTWIQPVASQNAAALKAATSQPNLLTAAPGAWTGAVPSSFQQYVSPLLGSSGSPGVLLLEIDPAGTLTNPITGDPITTDVFGNARTDAGKRDIGAVQTQLAPYLTAAASTTPGAVDLAWTRPADPTPALTGYVIEYKQRTAGSWTTGPSITGASTLTGQVTGLTAGTLYDFRVRGVNPAPGPNSNVASATPLTVPGTPTVTATGGQTTLAVSWTTPTDGGTPITGYVVQYRPQGSSPWTALPVIPAGTNTTTITGLAFSTTYEVRVTASNAEGSGPAGTTTGTTTAGDPPSAPLNVAGTPGNASATITWQPPASSGSTPVEKYKVVATPGGRTCTATAPTLTCTLTGLTNGTSYTVAARARNSIGWGPYSIASPSFTPVGPTVRTITILTHKRGHVRGRPGLKVTGTTTGFAAGDILRPWHRFPGETNYSKGKVRIKVDASGNFTWKRRTHRKIYVVIKSSDGAVKSERVIIPVH